MELLFLECLMCSFIPARATLEWGQSPTSAWWTPLSKSISKLSPLQSFPRTLRGKKISDFLLPLCLFIQLVLVYTVVTVSQTWTNICQEVWTVQSTPKALTERQLWRWWWWWWWCSCRWRLRQNHNPWLQMPRVSEKGPQEIMRWYEYFVLKHGALWGPLDSTPIQCNPASERG